MTRRVSDFEAFIPGASVEVLPYEQAQWAPRTGDGVALVWAWRVRSNGHEIVGATADDRAAAEAQAVAARERVSRLEQSGYVRRVERWCNR